MGIYKSPQIHECGNWDCGRAIPFLGIFVSNFRYWFFAVGLAGDGKTQDEHEFVGKRMSHG